MNIQLPEELARRGAETSTRLRKTVAAMRALQIDDARHPWVTIFATGSLGRHEAGAQSDLDVFLIDAARDERHLTNLERHELIAGLIQASRGAGFPPFSRDGEFLHVHHIDDLVRFLGKPDEDHLNVFTARMLLVLESECLVGQAAYDRCVETVLERYWAEDAEAHDFRPTILINDIVRYWKTLCLSYEGWRRELGRPLAADEKIDLLKLKFNRVWLCFVGLAYLLLGDDDMLFPRSHAQRLVNLTPVDRMREIGARAFQTSADHERLEPDHLELAARHLRELIERLLHDYAWWLEKTAVSKTEQEQWIAQPDAYHDASQRARAFGDDMWRLVMSLGDRVNLTRYLLV